MTEDALMLSHVARLQLGYQAEELTALRSVLQERGLADLEDENLFFFRAEISNELLDSHFTHMSETTLNNYADDSQRGVAFLRGHNWKELPLGYSVKGVVETGKRKRVVSDFYTVAGLADTDDLIARIRTGLVRDVSVGFHGGRAICDLCGADFWYCRHFPGLKYEEKEGDTVRTQLATFTIDDARLSEVSGVFDGSTPEAMILKAQRAAKAGELTRQQVALLENQYRIALPATSRFATVSSDKFKVSNEGSYQWNLGERTTEMDLTKVRSMLNVQTDEEVQEGVEKLMKRLSELEPQAKDGVQYREDLVKDALAEGVRAQGADFDQATYEATLKTLPIAAVKRFRDDWKKVADKSLPAGRQSQDEEQTPPKPTKADLVPDRAYA